jgi:hypothetical protein
VNKVLRDAACPVTKVCPQIKQVEGGFEIVGTNIPDDTIPDYERRVLVPATMLPELADLSIPDFEAWLAARRKTPGDMLRVQTLPQYAVPTDDADYAGYLNGSAGPTSSYREPFFQELRDEAARGMVWRNLVVLDGDPTPYQAYANEWVYTYSDKAGQDIRILDIAENPAASTLLRTGDYWVVEHRHVALVRYDDDYSHQGEVAVEDTSATGYIAAAEMAWQLGTPFAQWWAAHPQYRRRHLVA